MSAHRLGRFLLIITPNNSRFPERHAFSRDGWQCAVMRVFYTQIWEIMKKGEVEKAERIALNQFDKWNEVTGFVQEHTGYYYELQSIIKEAVHIGIQMSMLGKVAFDSDGNVIIPGLA